MAHGPGAPAPSTRRAWSGFDAPHDADEGSEPGGPDAARRVARHHFLPRLAGLALGFPCVASVLWANDAHPAVWALLVLHVVVWPHLALFIARRSAAPRHAISESLVADSAMGGVWIAVMQFNLLPSVLLAAMLAMDKIIAGGPRLLGRALLAQVLACVSVAAVTGFPWSPVTTLPQMLACFPLLLGYPALVGVLAWRLGARVREQNRMLQTLSRTDGLTGLANRMWWEVAVLREMKRQRRHKRPVSIVMVDIDHFKLINDRFGHPVGDAVIRTVAELLAAGIRAEDLAGRYGGEEFCLLLPDTDVEGARVVAERLRETIGAAIVEPVLRLRCTVSFGVAGIECGSIDPRPWIALADQALYRAKAEGRNRTVVAG